MTISNKPNTQERENTMKKTKKLSLDRETIRTLSASHLHMAHGGVSITGSAGPTFTTCKSEFNTQCGTCTTLVSFDHCP